MNHFNRRRAAVIATAIVALMGTPVFAAKTILLTDIVPGKNPLFSVLGATENHFYVQTSLGDNSPVIAINRTDQSIVKLLPYGIPWHSGFITSGALSLFGYNDNSHGNELWRSDGTREGTHLLKDLIEGPVSGHPQTFVNWRNKAYFITPVQVDPRNPVKSRPPQMWSTDGTSQGTQLVSDLDTLTRDNGDEYVEWGSVVQLKAGQDKLFFNVRVTAPDGETEIRTLWQSDGTAQGTAKMVHPQENVPFLAANLLETVGGILFFADDQPHSFEYSEWTRGKLWRTDGTGQGTTALTDALAVQTIGVFEGRVYFLTRDDSGLYLARTNDTSTAIETVAFLYPATSITESIFAKFVAGTTSLFIGIDNRYFQGTVHTVWRFSGADETTEQIAEIPNSSLDSMVVKDDMVYFDSRPEDNIEPWRSFKGLAAGSNPRQFTALKNGAVLFRAPYLYTTGGTHETTSVLELSRNTCWNCLDSLGTASIWMPTPMGNGALFLEPMIATLWHTDGSNTDAGARFIKGGIWPTLDGGYWITKKIFGSVGRSAALFFTFERNPDRTYTFLRKLWRTDGTNKGTVLVKSFSIPEFYWRIMAAGTEGLTAHRGLVFFVANDGEHGNELWRSDGSESGTYMVKDLIQNDANRSTPIIQNITSAHRHLYFTYSDGCDYTCVSEVHLAKSRGSAGDIVHIATLPANSNAAQNFTAVNDTLFFRAGRELYRSNGRPGNLQRLGQFAHSTADNFSNTVTTDWPAAMTAFGNHLYFVARKGADDPLQVWRADCTKESAEIVTPNFHIPVRDARDAGFYVHQNRLFLAVMDRLDRRGGIFELRIRGKNSQWVRHTNMSARELRVAGDKMYFAGLDDQYGEEPRVMALPKKP